MEMEVNEEEDEQLNFTTSPNTNNIYYNMFQGSYDFIEDVVRVILRCLGFEEENSSNSSQACCTSAAPAPVTTTTDAAAIGTTTTTPDLGGSDGGDADDSAEIADSGGQESSPDIGGGGGGDDDAGTVADPPGADTPSVGAGRIATTAAIKKPPRPPISTGRGGQIH
ncbi:hypothetical protein BVRB_1g021450 isoform B [Beta vulgaris subsp. vulgaris]|uniref:uncharacterized protein LOC104905694 isoform X2 n=1 Tax=Beta vulgaris subsp. vulgaris TaxID=3555 RepID=UPI00053F2F7E|nr:uncharacterized protein LOC104905694 isoform X2 [Beta vulgaris subsp. vulgaris]KMS99713.1 hypothetical protein BVRB_1g021450 isoform B [Beta vulgaris subsp. vulgaris]